MTYRNYLNKQLGIFFISTALIFACLEPLSLIIGLGPIKDLRFLAPVLVGVFIFKKNNNVNQKIIKYYNKIFVIIVLAVIQTIFVFVVVHDLNINFRNVVNIVLIISPIVFAWGFVSYDVYSIDKIIKFFFLIFSFVFLIQLVKGGVSLSDITEIFKADITKAQKFETESNVSLIMCLFSIYFLDQKNRMYSIIAILFTIIGAKRIAILALIVGVLIYYYFPFKKSKQYKKIISFIFLTFGLITAFIWDGLIKGYFDVFIAELLGVSSNLLLSGRMSRYSMVFDAINIDLPWGVGIGIGYLQSILYYVVDYASAFHGDFYRIYLEFGAILFAFWLYITGKYAAFSKLSLSASVMLVILMLTDNVFNYVRIMYIYYFIMAIAIRDNLNEK